MNDNLITRDRMKYEKNKLSSSLALIAIAFNALFFASIYRGVKADIGMYYANILMGGSVLLNLVFMLATFLSSEGVKNYKMPFAVTLLVLAALQIGRIFIYPLGAHTTVLSEADGVKKMVMETPQFIRCLIYLSGSAVCLIVAGVFGIIKTLQLKQHKAAHPEVFVDFGDETPVCDTVPGDAAASPVVFGQEPINKSGNKQ